MGLVAVLKCRCRRFSTALFVIGLVLFGPLATAELMAQPAAAPLTDDQRKLMDEHVVQLDRGLQTVSRDGQTDAAIFAKGLRWALAYDQLFTDADRGLMEKSFVRGLERIEQLKSNSSAWLARRGKLALGYVSLVDGSVQPYGLIVPKSYDPSRPIRLDVVLHGSTRPVGLSELRFISRFDEGDKENASPPDQPWIELHPLGRVENCYRWAGETDVFEAIEDVCRRFNIDRDRIVLRGMSMGASGTWHLGLKHPDRFVALGPYCGYVDTHRFSETPLPTFVKVGALPDHQEVGLHMLDSVDYAANAGVVPVVACIGAKDIFFDAHVIMDQAFQREGLTLVNLISPNTGHEIDPVTQAEQLRQIAGFVGTGLNRKPSKLRFVTWTLKYNECDWLSILKLGQHYARAEFSANLNGETLEIAEPTNIQSFSIQTSMLPTTPKVVRVGQTEFKLSDHQGAKLSAIRIERRENQWRIVGDAVSRASDLTGKRPGLQGPIDDAFTSPFLCVRGTGKSWNPAVQAYCDASLKRFAEEWRHYFRGDLPIKNDTEVTEDDIQSKNLVLFGDPGSNPWIAKVLPQLPLKWTQDTLHMNGEDYLAAEHVPACITASPLAGASKRYLVLNSGHSFREAELAKLNYLLFPRWGDWAVLKIDSKRDMNEPVKEVAVKAGYFDEEWQFKSH